MTTRAISELSPKAQAAYKADPKLAATRNAQVADSSAPPAGSSSAPAAAASPGIPIPTPDLSDWSVPGDGPVEKALIVLGILILGLGVYSRIFGKTINLSLAGFGLGNPPLSQPTLAPTIANKTAAANPARVGA